MITRKVTTITILYDKPEGDTAAIQAGIHQKEGYRIQDYEIATEIDKGYYILTHEEKRN